MLDVILYFSHFERKTSHLYNIVHVFNRRQLLFIISCHFFLNRRSKKIAFPYTNRHKYQIISTSILFYSLDIPKMKRRREIKTSYIYTYMKKRHTIETPHGPPQMRETISARVQEVACHPPNF